MLQFFVKGIAAWSFIFYNGQKFWHQGKLILMHSFIYLILLSRHLIHRDLYSGYDTSKPKTNLIIKGLKNMYGS